MIKSAVMLELLTNAEMAQADRMAVAGGIPGIDLMENAGRAVADRLADRHPSGSRVVVVAGTGNNGGDGFVAARLLGERGFSVRVLLAGEIGKLSGDAAEAARRWAGSPEPATPSALDDADAVIDALFGAGLDRPVQGAAAALIEAINATGAPVVAVDLPRPRRSPSSVASSGISCCLAVCIAATSMSATSEFPRACLRASSRALSSMRRLCGPIFFRCRASMGTNIPAVMRSWFPAESLRQEPPGSPPAVPCAPAPAW
jgi:hydroxyethylthiazole kinase-like uncharacterized protein yjeF